MLFSTVCRYLQQAEVDDEAEVTADEIADPVRAIFMYSEHASSCCMNSIPQESLLFIYM